MDKKKLVLLVSLIFIIGLTTVSAASSDDTGSTDVASDSHVATDTSDSTNSVQSESTHVNQESATTQTSVSSDTSSDTKSVSTSDSSSNSKSISTSDSSSNTKSVSSDSTTNNEKVNNDVASKEVTTSTSNSTEKTDTTTSTSTIDAKTLKTDGETYTVTNDNFDDYFDSNGRLSSSISEGSIIEFEGEISQRSITINIPVNVTSSTTSQAVLNNMTMGISADYTNVTNLILNAEGSGGLISVSGSYVSLINNTLSIINYNDATTNGVGFSGDYLYMNGNNITTSGYAKDSGDETHSLTGSGQYFTIENNTFTTNSTDGHGHATIIGVHLGSNGNFTNNIVHTEIPNSYTNSEEYAYAIYPGENNLIKNNTIEAFGINYACGIDEGSNNQIIENIIYVSSGGASYGIYNCEYSTIMQNYIVSNGYGYFGIELWDKSYNDIINNTITTVSCSAAMGIGIAGSQYNNIINNTITFNTTGFANIVDSIGLENTGIKICLGSNNNNVTGNNITSQGEYSVVFDSNTNNNTVTENYILAKTLSGDKAVSSLGNNIIENNYPEYIEVIITNDTYYDYFNEDGTVKEIQGNLILLSGVFTNKNFVIEDSYTISTDTDQAILYNSTITLNATEATIENLIINNTDYAETIITLYNATSNSTYNIQNNTLIVNNSQTGSHAINITSDYVYVNISNNNIEVSGLSDSLEDEFASVSGIFGRIGIMDYFFGKDYKIISNNITVSSHTSSENVNEEDVVVGIDLIFSGDYFPNTSYGLENYEVYSNNIINVTGTNYAYGIKLRNEVSGDILDNSITCDANNTYGIYFYTTERDQINANATLNSNNITLLGNSFASGISLNNTELRIDSCNIDVKADVSTLVEAINSEIMVGNSNLTGEGNYIIGIGLNNTTGLSSVSIYNNTITTTGNSSNPVSTTIGYVTPSNNGIKMESSTSNITGNVIYTYDLANNTDVYTIDLESSVGNTVTNNTLYSTNLNSSNSVNGKDDNNVYDNLPFNNELITLNVNVPTTTIKQFDKYNMSVNATDSEGNIIKEGSITITVAGNLIGTYDLSDDTNSIEYYSLLSGSQDLVVQYISNDNYRADSVTTQLTVEEQEITTGPLYVSPEGDDHNSGSEDSPLKTIERAITIALQFNSTRQIILLEGTFYENIVLDTSFNITGQGNVILDGLNQSQILSVTSDNVTISNITFANGYSTNGGAIINSGNLTLLNCTFTQNTASNGGAIYNTGSLTISNSTFIENTATSSTTGYGGGAIYNTGSLTISNSTFIENTAYSGGAICLANGNANITNSTFTQNTASNGGAISHYLNDYPLTITNSNFINNTASLGGVLYTMMSPQTTITDSNFINNSASTRGGVVDVYRQDSVNITNSNLINNTAPRGAAIYNPGTLNLENCNVTNTISSYVNSATTLVPLIYNTRSTITMTVENTTRTVSSSGTSYTFTTTGDKTVTFDYSLYPDNNIQLIVQVADSLAVTVEPIEVTNGNTVELKATVTDFGNGVTNGSVIFKINGKTVRDEDGNVLEVPIVDGVASYNYTLPVTSSNTYTISAVYTGEGGVARSENTTVTIPPKTANIQLTTTGTLMPGQTVTFTANITDESGNAVTTGKVVFKLNGVSLKDAEGNVIYAYVENGIATINYTIPSNFSAKDYTLTAVFQGTGYERTEINDTITISKIDTSVSVDSSIINTTTNTITITQGENLELKATIIDQSTSNAVTGTTKIAVKINEKTVVQQYVTDGVIDLTIYTSSFKNPVYSIEIIAGENSQYNKSSYNGTLSVVEPNSLLKNETSNNGTLLVAKD